MPAVSPDVTVHKVLRRVLPWTMLLLVLNLLDRTNISFAALQMNVALGFTPQVYGMAAGIFFIGYFLCEIPSNLLLVRVGARVWLARIMITWGMIVACMAATRGVHSFYALRFLLGVAEAGLLPGVLLYLSRWVPVRQLGLAYSLLMAATALANVVSGPIAGALLQVDGLWGLQGWQAMFIIEGASTVLIGAAVAWYLPERPQEARWLEEQERAWLSATLAREGREKAGVGVTSFWQSFLDRRVLLATLVCFLFVCCNFGTVFWLPQIVHSFTGLDPLRIGLLAAVPYLLGGVATIAWGRHSDRTRDRRWHLVAGAMLAAASYAAAGLAVTGTPAFLCLCVATLGIWSMFGVFWAHAGSLLGGAGAPAGLAFINSVSALGGFVGPVLIGVVQQKTHNFSASLFVLAVFALLTAAAALCIQNAPRPAPEPGVLAT
jgi:ACS family tartrate transporter-like MFS transporter